ncbi:MAG TPA: C40 family peptidase [Prolixibacteraceae bacterium]|nr:C40 family peptidase [Prolixibacteraceae bacterium]
MLKRIYVLITLLLLTMLSHSRDKVHQTAAVNQSSVNHVVSRDELIAFAKSFLGSPYRYGSSNPIKGFDCSGFVNFVFNNFKIKLPRSSMEFKSIGEEISPEEFKQGDVVVFYGFRNKDRIGHVGIICEANGMQSKFIHSSSGKTKGVIISELGSEMYTRRFYKCVDVISGK